MSKKEDVSKCWRFGQVDYSVTMSVDGNVLSIEVEDSLAADVWRATFDPKQLEELTRKTGNYKQFSVFVSMLKAAITRTSDSVSLDLLTYADLEILRSQKYGGTTHRGVSPGPKSTQAQVHSKRYLILTYSVEFDRIHYPLSLPYSGKTDPTKLQETIRKLRAEIAMLQKSHSKGHTKNSELYQLQQDYDVVLQEKEELEELFEAFKNEVTLSRDGTAAKQIKILKQAVRNLETELAKEKSKYQRFAQKKGQEIRELMEELDEVKSSERNLRIRLKSVSNELAIYKQGQLHSRHPPSTAKSGGGKAVRQRTSSTERQLKRQNSSSASKYRMRTPSPSGSRFPRFDPTAYIQDKLRRQQDANLRLGRAKVTNSLNRLRSRSNSGERASSGTRRPPRPVSSTRPFTGYLQGQRSRTSSVGSNVSSRASSRSSSRRPSLTRSDSENSISQLQNRRTKGPVRNRTSSAGKQVRTVRKAWDSPQTTTINTPGQSTRKTACQGHDGNVSDRSMELSEIDARLNALQEFMKKSLSNRTPS